MACTIYLAVDNGTGVYRSVSEVLKAIGYDRDPGYGTDVATRNWGLYEYFAFGRLPDRVKRAFEEEAVRPTPLGQIAHFPYRWDVFRIEEDEGGKPLTEKQTRRLFGWLRANMRQLGIPALILAELE